MRSLRMCLLMGAAAVVGLAGCESSHNRAQGSSDHQITAEIRSKLDRDPVYKFTQVDVKTFDGVVQLGGFVNNEDQKRRATQVAESVSGVKQVENGMSLKPTTPSATGRTY